MAAELLCAALRDATAASMSVEIVGWLAQIQSNRK